MNMEGTVVLTYLRSWMKSRHCRRLIVGRRKATAAVDAAAADDAVEGWSHWIQLFWPSDAKP